MLFYHFYGENTRKRKCCRDACVQLQKRPDRHARVFLHLGVPAVILVSVRRHGYLLPDGQPYCVGGGVLRAAAVDAGQAAQLAAAFKDKQVLKREIPAAVFLFGDWIVYLWAVQNGRVLECSLGYYIQPLVVFAFGAVIFKEKISWRHFVIIAIVVVGIVLSTSGFGGVPYVTIALATMFAIYAAIKKSLTIDSIVSTTMEIIMMVPVAIVFVLCCRMGDNGMGSLTVARQLLLMGSGVVTAVPMLFYAIGVRNLPLMTTGICQYLSPTLAIFAA